jgi:hypothetical protein
MVIFCFVIYGLAIPSIRFSNGYITVPLAFLFLFVLAMEAVFALRFIEHLKNGSLFSIKMEKRSSLINNIAIFVSAILFIAVLLNIKSVLRQRPYPELFSDLSAIISTIAAIYLCSTYGVVKKAIVDKHYEMIESIGGELNS